MERNLVLAVVGDESVHESWLAGLQKRSFDLCLIYFGDQPGRFRGDADVYIERKGIKFALIYELVQRELAEVLPHYDRIWIPDDDVAADVARVNRLFELARQYNLEICQPAIAVGDLSFQALRAQPEYILRYSQFVEMMCPLFTQRAFQKVLPLFNANASGWGIDWVWSSWFAADQVAVIDATPMDHTRPLRTSGVHDRFRRMGVDPSTDLKVMIAKHNLNNRRVQRAMARGTARLRGVRLDGSRVWTRSRLSMLIERLTPKSLRTGAAA